MHYNTRCIFSAYQTMMGCIHSVEDERGKLSVLQEPPFADQGSIVELFTDLSVWMGIREIIEQVAANALTA